MQQYTPKEQAEMLKLFYENQFSVVVTQRAFVNKQNSHYWGTVKSSNYPRACSIRSKLSGVEFARRKSSDRTFLKTITAKRFPSMVAVTELC